MVPLEQNQLLLLLRYRQLKADVQLSIFLITSFVLYLPVKLLTLVCMHVNMYLSVFSHSSLLFAFYVCVSSFSAAL